jgi:hypothetical protein
MVPAAREATTQPNPRRMRFGLRLQELPTTARRDVAAPLVIGLSRAVDRCGVNGRRHFREGLAMKLIRRQNMRPIAAAAPAVQRGQVKRGIRDGSFRRVRATVAPPTGINRSCYWCRNLLQLRTPRARGYGAQAV